MKNNKISENTQNAQENSGGGGNLTNCDIIQIEGNLLNCNAENLNNKWNYENGFYLTSQPNRIGKMLAQYELYKKIINLPGDVLEFGVYKGASLLRLATFRNLLENDFSRKIIGFDMFGKFPTTDDELDNKFIQSFENDGGYGIDKEELEKFIDYKNLQNVKLVKGDINETLDIFLEETPHLRISLLHIDVDVYQPTKLILDKLFDRVVRGGLIILDDYNTVNGETNAVDEFLVGKNEVIQKLPLSHIPSFIEKL